MATAGCGRRAGRGRGWCDGASAGAKVVPGRGSSKVLGVKLVAVEMEGQGALVGADIVDGDMISRLVWGSGVMGVQAFATNSAIVGAERMHFLV